MVSAVRGDPYRTMVAPSPPEPWLERAGWEGPHAPSRGLVAAVHVVWGDEVLASAWVPSDGELDPWRAAGGGAQGVAVRARGGEYVFVMSPDPRGRVEGPGGTLDLAALIAEGYITPEGESGDEREGGYAIAMEPGLVYRTYRGGLGVTAELVARPGAAPRSKRGRSLAVAVALAVATWTLGHAAIAATVTDASVEARDEGDRVETLAALIAREGRGAPREIPVRPQPVVHIPRDVLAAWPGCALRDDPWCVAQSEPFIGINLCPAASRGARASRYASAVPWPYFGPGPVPPPGCIDEMEEREARPSFAGRIVVHASATPVGNGVPPAALERTARRGLAAVRACESLSEYEHPAVAGRVEVGVVVHPDGGVSTTVHRNQGAGAGAARCIAAAVRHWTFPRPTQGAATGVLAFDFR